MANDFGTILPDVQGVTNVVTAPGHSGGSPFLSLLGDGLKGITNLWEGHVEAKKQAAQLARQKVQDDRATITFNQGQTDRQNKQQGGAIEGDVTYGLFQIGQGQWETNGWVGKPEGPPVEQAPNPEIVAAVDKMGTKIDNTKAAVSQGKMPAISAEAQINQLFQFSINKYGNDPQTIAQIAGAFDKRGIKNALIQSYLDERAVADKTQDSKLALEAKAIEYLSTHGTPGEVIANMSREDQVAHGLTLMQKDNALDVLQKQASLNATNISTEIQQKNFNEKDMNEAWSVQAKDAIITAMNPTIKAMQQTLNMLGEPGSKPEFEARYASILPKARQQFANLVSRYIQKSGIRDAQTAENVRQSLTRDFEETVMKPYETRNTAYTSAATAIQTKLRIGMEVAAPMLQAARRMGYDPTTIATALGTLPPEAVAGIAREAKGLTKGNLFTPSATIHLMNMMGVLEGQKNLDTNMTPKERSTVVAGSYRYAEANVQNVINGTGDGHKWINSARQLVIASNGINAQTPLQDIRGVAYALYDDKGVAAINKLRTGDTKEEADLLAHGTRASAGVTLSALQTNLRQTKVEGWIIGTTSDGGWTKRPDPNWKPKSVYHRSDLIGGTVDQTTRPAFPGSVQSTLDAANLTLGFLVNTGNWDTDAPKGSRKEVRRMWSRGEPTTEMRKASETAKSQPSLGKQFDALEAELDKAPDILSSSDNSDIIGPEGTGKNPRSSAVGTGQFTEDTWVTTLSNHAPEAIKGKSRAEILALRTADPELARDAVGWLRSDNGKALSAAGVPATKENTALAHFAGSGGAVALLKADPSTPAERVLGPRAINANPHLKGMTAAQVIAWARKFYA